jgi:hypothetical protein
MGPLVQEVLQQVLEAKMDECLAASKGERPETRRGYRSGSYRRGLVTPVGKIEVRVPRDPTSSLAHRVVRALPGKRENAGGGLGRDVHAGRVDPQGQGHHRRVFITYRRPRCVLLDSSDRRPADTK